MFAKIQLEEIKKKRDNTSCIRLIWVIIIQEIVALSFTASTRAERLAIDSVIDQSCRTHRVKKYSPCFIYFLFRQRQRKRQTRKRGRNLEETMFDFHGTLQSLTS